MYSRSLPSLSFTSSFLSLFFLYWLQSFYSCVGFLFQFACRNLITEIWLQKFDYRDFTPVWVFDFIYKYSRSLPSLSFMFSKLITEIFLLCEFLIFLYVLSEFALPEFHFPFQWLFFLFWLQNFYSCVGFLFPFSICLQKFDYRNLITEVWLQKFYSCVSFLILYIYINK